MRAFKDQPLRRKALTLGIVPAAFAVVLLAIASVSATYMRARSNVMADLDSQGAILSESLAAAVALGDRASASATLNPLRFRANLEAVCVFGENGELFASFEQGTELCESSRVVAQASEAPELMVEHPLLRAGRQLGTVRLRGNMGRYYVWLRAQLVAILLALVGGTLIAFVLTRRLQRVISEPVLDLATTADAVSASRNYSLRAVKTTDDEVGGLVQSFNSMLDEIQRQNQLLTIEIAERKRAEELKDTFLAAVSHELRTPLNAIMGRVQLLRHMKPTEERLERALDSLERNAQSQARLVEDLLDVSRIVSGKFQMKFEVVDLRAVVARAIDVVAPQASVKGIRINLAGPAEACLVSGDGDRLQQAVMNLLSNAVKFSHSGTIAVELAAMDATAEFAISVHDDGIGIAPDFLPIVFERFRQADGSMTRQHGGLGLGLAIVKEVADLHGGSVKASSPGLGRGSRFTLRIPQLVEADVASRRGRGRLTAEASTPLREYRILVVDDDPDSLEIAATALSTAGATVTSAASGGEAIDIWHRDGRFDALVCDLAMPGMDGFEVLERIRNHGSSGARPALMVALTAYASNEYRDRSLAAGFHIHLAKPFNTEILVMAITDALVRVGGVVRDGTSSFQ